MTDYMAQYKRNLKAINASGKATPHLGDIWWVSNLDGIKDRPILVLEFKDGVVTFLKCTSQSKDYRESVLIEDYYEAGLEKATYIDPQIRTISRNRLVRRLGKLSDYDASKIDLN